MHLYVFELPFLIKAFILSHVSYNLCGGNGFNLSHTANKNLQAVVFYGIPSKIITIKIYKIIDFSVLIGSTLIEWFTVQSSVR